MNNLFLVFAPLTFTLIGVHGQAVNAAKPAGPGQNTELAVAEYGAGRVAHVTLNKNGRAQVNTIDVNGMPFDVKSPDGTTVYASVQANSSLPGSVDSIKVLSIDKKDTVTGSMPAYGTPRNMANNAAGTLLAVAHSNGADLHFIGLNSGVRANAYLTTITMQGSTNVAFSGNVLVVTSSTGRVLTFDVTNPAAPALIQEKYFPVAAMMAAFSPDGTKLYLGFAGTAQVYDQAGNVVEGNLLVVDPSTLGVLSAHQLGYGDLYAAKIASSRLYVASQDGTLYVLDPATDLLAYSVYLGGMLMDMDASSIRLYVSAQDVGKINVLQFGGSPSTDQVLASIDLAGVQPVGLAVLR